jgi:hypothetical protein
MGKHSSLFGPFVSYGEKKFCNLSPWNAKLVSDQEQKHIISDVSFSFKISERAKERKKLRELERERLRECKRQLSE